MTNFPALLLDAPVSEEAALTELTALAARQTYLLRVLRDGPSLTACAGGPRCGRCAGCMSWWRTAL